MDFPKRRLPLVSPVRKRHRARPTVEVLEGRALLATVFADKVLDFFDSGAGPMAGPYGGTSPGTKPQDFPVPVSVNVVLGDERAGKSDFLSLPTGSYVTVGFPSPIVDGPGNDITIVELGDVNERATVLVKSQTSDFVTLGTARADRASSFDLGTIGFREPVVAVRIVGLDNGGESPGFDVAGVTGQTADAPSPDIRIVSAQSDASGMVSFLYEVEGNPGPFTVGLYRSADTTFDPSVDELAGPLQTITPVPNSSAQGTLTLQNPLTDQTRPNLLVVADPPNPALGKPSGDVLESNEGNNVALAVQSSGIDFQITNVRYADPAKKSSILFDWRYQSSDQVVHPFVVGIYRSTDKTFDPSDAPILRGLWTTITPTSPNSQGTERLNLGSGLKPNIFQRDQPNILIVADPPGMDRRIGLGVDVGDRTEISEIDETNNAGRVTPRIFGFFFAGRGAAATGTGVDNLRNAIATDPLLLNPFVSVPFGFSGGPVRQFYILRTRVRTLLSSFGRESNEPVILIGHSFGGNVAYLLSRNVYGTPSRPVPARALITLDPISWGFSIFRTPLDQSSVTRPTPIGVAPSSILNFVNRSARPFFSFSNLPRGYNIAGAINDSILASGPDRILNTGDDATHGSIDDDEGADGSKLGIYDAVKAFIRPIADGV